MAEQWSSWGDTGPVIGVSATKTESKDSVTVYFYFMYCRRYAYSATSTFQTTATAYIDGSYYDSVSFKPYSSSYNVGVNYNLITGSKTFYKSNTSYNVSFDFSCTDWGNLTWNKINGNDSSAAQLATLSISIPAITKIDTPIINTNYSVRLPSDNSFTISWNQIANASGYYVTLSDSSGSYNNSASVTSTSKTFIVDNLSNYRGKTFTAYVYAIGSGNYANSSIVSKTIAIINTPPAYPTITSQSSSSLTTQNSIRFVVTAGLDEEGHSTSLYYSFDGGTTKKDFVSPLTITHETVDGGGIVSGQNTISFYTYDGYEYSTAANKTFTATFAPIISPSIVTTHTYVESMTGNTDTLATDTKISFSMASGTPKTISLFVRSSSNTTFSGDGVSVPIGKDTYSQSTQTINIKLTDIMSLVPDGYYYQFAFKVSDGISSSDLTAWQNYARKPMAPVLPIYNSYSNDKITSQAKDNYYKKYVTINFTNPANNAARAKITSLGIVAIYDNTSKEYSCSTTPGSSSVKMDLSQINANTSTTFKFKIVDAAGLTKIEDIYSSDTTALTLIKSSMLAFGGSIINVNNSNLKPMTNVQDFIIAHPIAQASGTNTIIYSYDMQIGETKVAINQYTIDTSDPTQIKVTIAAEKINALALTLVTNYDLAYEAIIRVKATDGFGELKDIQKTITINFTEPPVFDNLNFNLKHDYYTERTSITTSTGTIVPTVTQNNWETVKDIVMVNSGESIIFVLPKATDPNDDISEYRIFLSRNDFINESAVLKYNEVTFGQTPWLIIPYDILTKGVSDSNYYYYLFKASQYTKNEYFYFKLQARDSTGNVSKEIICQNYIIGCRTVSPTFSAGNIRVDRNGESVILTYNFKITDLGGSAKSSGWDRNYYNNYPNFERNIAGYTPKASLIIEIAPDQSFTTNVITSSPIIFEPTDNLGLADFISTQTRLSGFAESHPKIFMRFTLTVSYGLQNSSTNATVTSIPQIYTYFGAVPTVAHRAHKVGINTNTLGQDDIMVIENYQGTRYVRFKGTDASNASQTYEITFDLLNGTITGAVINCGEW